MSTPVQHFDKTNASYERLSGGCTREVAQYLLAFDPKVDASSVVLDNACGTGIITEEILEAFPVERTSRPTIYATDLAPSMVSLLAEKATNKAWANSKDGLLETFVMNAEDLTFPDNLFSHSYTNLGILFFNDPEKAAAQIHRTLRPGGSAFITTWQTLGYLVPIRKAQEAAKPGGTPWELPIDKAWFTEEKLEQVLVSGGFKKDNIRVYSQEVSFKGNDLHDLVDIIKSAFTPAITKGWSGEERERWYDALEESLSKEEKATASIKMITFIGIARKES